MKRILSVIAVVLVLSISISLAACSNIGSLECRHRDENANGKCDKCGEAYGTCTHEDENGDNVCDKCGDYSGSEGIDTPLIPLDPQ